MNHLSIDWNDFLKNYWQKKPVILRNAFKNFQDPITPDELAGLAMEEELDSRLVTNKDGVWDAKFGPFESYDHLGETNWSLLVQAVDHWHEQAATLIEPFMCIPRWQFEDLMISFATPQAGVGPHIDNYDVFIIQGMGKRRWQVGDRNPDYKQYSAHKALLHVEEYEPIIDEVIEAGDILYIPIGYPHNGVSLTDSLSYSVGFRAPTSQEMLSGFADYVIDQLPQGIFYQDPDMQLPNNSYQIQDYEINKIKQQMIALIENPELFNNWFGAQITQPMHELNIIPVEPEYTLETFIEDLESGLTLYRVPSIRILQIADKLYIHGECMNSNTHLDNEQLLMLCQKEQLTLSDINEPNILDIMLGYVNKGYWYFDN